MTTDRYPLPFSFDFLSLFDQGDHTGPFGPKFNITYAYRVTGPLREDVLFAALADVVERHSALRTVFVRGEHRHLRVLPPAPVPITSRDLSDTPDGDRGRRAERLLLEVEAGDYGATEAPLLRAVLGRFDAEDAVLVLIAHHSVTDEWSMSLIARDLAGFYAARVTGTAPDLPPTRQFVTYAAWEKAQADSPAMGKAKAFWRRTLAGAQIEPLRTDHPRSADLPKKTAWARFTVPERLSRAIAEVARTLHCSPFMVMLAAYRVYLSEQTGETDVVVMSFTSGRGTAAYHETVGSFFNFIPLRTDIAGCASFPDVVRRVRRTCLQAYQHEIPFLHLLDELPELMAAATEDHGAICTFQVYKAPLDPDFDAGDVRFSQIRERQLEHNSGDDLPDGAMWHLDLDLNSDMHGSLAYNTNLYTATHMTELTTGYLDMLDRTVTGVDTTTVTARGA